MGMKVGMPAGGSPVQKYLVQLADADGGAPIRDRDRLQKMMFLASEADGDLDRECRFEPDSRGPHSEVINEELEHLAGIGVLRKIGGGVGITRKGRRIARETSRSCNADTCLMILNLKEFLNDMTAKELVGYVCTAHPEMACKSAEYERIKPQVEGILLALIRKGKITSGRAANLLGKPRHYVIGLMKEAGIAYLH